MICNGSALVTNICFYLSQRFFAEYLQFPVPLSVLKCAKTEVNVYYI